jgi:hypothetical protein
MVGLRDKHAGVEAVIVKAVDSYTELEVYDN